VTKIEEFAHKTPDQLSDDLTKLKKEQFNLRFQRATGQLENTARIRVVRRDIARILTVVQQKSGTMQGAAPNGEAGAKPAKARTSKPKAKASSKAKAKSKSAATGGAKRASRAKTKQ